MSMQSYIVGSLRDALEGYTEGIRANFLNSFTIFYWTDFSVHFSYCSTHYDIITGSRVCGLCPGNGQVSSGPDLTGAVARKGEKWCYEFTLDPESKFNEPYVKTLIEYFNLRMPNQHMTAEETKDIVEYMKWIDKNADLF